MWSYLLLSLGGYRKGRCSQVAMTPLLFYNLVMEKDVRHSRALEVLGFSKPSILLSVMACF